MTNPVGINEWLRRHWDEYETRDERLAACAKAFKKSSGRLTKKSFSDAHSRISREKRTASAPSCEVPSDLIPAEKIFEKIDIPARIRDFLSLVVKSGFIADDRLRDRLNVSRTEWRNVRNLEEFKDNVFTFLDSTQNNRRITVWGNKETVRRARATVSLGRYEA